MGKNAKQHRRQQTLAEAIASRPENVKHPENRLLSAAGIRLLRDRGIDIECYPFFPPNHVAYPSGYIAILPSQIDGNRILGMEGHYASSRYKEDAVTNMPSLTLWGDNNAWHICVAQYVPGPGPGDFLEQFETEAEAIAGAIHYFFEPNQHVDAANAAAKEFLARVKPAK